MLFRSRYLLIFCFPVTIAPESPEDISGYSMYCYTYNPAEEIAHEGGVDVADVVLYEFDGYTRAAKYKEVTA